MPMIAKVLEVKYNRVHGSYLLFWPVKRFEYIFRGSKWFEEKKQTTTYREYLISLFTFACDIGFLKHGYNPTARRWLETATNGFSGWYETSFDIVSRSLHRFERYISSHWKRFMRLKTLRRIVWIDSLQFVQCIHGSPLGIIAIIKWNLMWY